MRLGELVLFHLSDLLDETLGEQLLGLYAFAIDHTSGRDRRRTPEN